MPTFPRLEFPGYPYHVIQRGNRSQKVFIRLGDKDCYLAILKLQCQLFDVEVWAYCLMDNHVHLIVMRRQGNGLSECIGETHRQYTRMINFREKWRGYLCQGRFKSFPMDDHYLMTAVRYVELNPVRAAIVKNPEDFIESESADTRCIFNYESSLGVLNLPPIRLESLLDFYFHGGYYVSRSACGGVRMCFDIVRILWYNCGIEYAIK